MIFKQNSKVVMIGDSITDCNRTRPIGEGNQGAHGDGYVNLINAFLSITYPKQNIRIVNMGISGNTVRDLNNRWQTDVFDLNPDYVSIMIGINDVWRQLDRPYGVEKHVSIDEYRSTLENLIKATKSRVQEVILISPYFIELNKFDKMRQMMDEYRGVVKSLALKYQTHYVDVQDAFDDVLSHFHSSYFAWDRVHPNTAGHMLIAKAFLTGIGFDWKK